MKKHLIFLADISGFTEFTSLSEINHGAHLISDLFRVINNENNIGLKLIELEGDAMQLVKVYEGETEKEIYDLALRMFLAFHSYLLKYDVQKICQCQACANVTMLNIKFFVHKAKLVEINLEQLTKYFGSGMITIHRLMKNTVPVEDYILFTDEFNLKALDQPGVKESVNLDHLGKQKYFYLGLQKYLVSLNVSNRVFYVDSFVLKLTEWNLTTKVSTHQIMSVLSDLCQKAIMLQDEPSIISEKSLMAFVGNSYTILFQEEKFKVIIAQLQTKNGAIHYVEYYPDLFVKGDVIKTYVIKSNKDGYTELSLFYSLKANHQFEGSELELIDELAAREMRQLIDEFSHVDANA